MKESDLYPQIERWMKRHFLCFATATNTGLRYSRPDIMGVRDIGGDHSGDVESIIRFLCPDCVSHVLAEFKLQGDG